MRFNPRARVGGSQIDDRTGGGGGGGGGAGGGIGGGVVGLLIGLLGRRGGIWGILGIVVVVVVYFFLAGGTGGGSGSGGTSSGDFDSCTGAQANRTQECRLVFVTKSVQDFWSAELPKETGKKYVVIKTVPFSRSVATQGCGTATSDAGPFYCPNDQRVYLDLSFFSSLLEQLGGKDTAFTEAYVVAHEYGHHIQNQLGLIGRVRTQQGANSDAVRLETMADCLAGVWAKNATSVPDDGGQPLITDLTDADIADGISAAKVVGDDAIQSKTSGRVNPEGWTHGSSAQRVAAFKVGLRDGTISACNFFDSGNRNYPRS